MRTTLDLPEPLLRKLKARAATEGTTMKALLRNAVEQRLGESASPPKRRRLQFPLLDSVKPGSLRITNAEIDEILT